MAGISWPCGDIIPKAGIPDGRCQAAHQHVPGNPEMGTLRDAWTGLAAGGMGTCPWLLLPLQSPKWCSPGLFLLLTPTCPLPSDVLLQWAAPIPVVPLLQDAAWGRDRRCAPLLARPRGVSPRSRVEPSPLLLSQEASPYLPVIEAGWDVWGETLALEGGGVCWL